VAILREHLIEHVPVSDLCDKHKLRPKVFYQWQKAFFENGTTAFESRRPRSQSLSEEEDKIAALETKLRNKTEVPLFTARPEPTRDFKIGERCHR
jgi:transposase